MAMLRVAVTLVLVSLAAAITCPAISLNASPISAACANAATVCTVCLTELSAQLGPPLRAAVAAQPALLNATADDLQSCLLPAFLPLISTVPNLISVISCDQLASATNISTLLSSTPPPPVASGPGTPVASPTPRSPQQQPSAGLNATSGPKATEMQGPPPHNGAAGKNVLIAGLASLVTCIAIVN